MPASMRCLYSCTKSSTGELDRPAMLAQIREEAAKVPDKKDRVKYVPGTVRGKKVVEAIEYLCHWTIRKNDFFLCGFTV